MVAAVVTISQNSYSFLAPGIATMAIDFQPFFIRAPCGRSQKMSLITTRIPFEIIKSVGILLNYTFVKFNALKT